MPKKQLSPSKKVSVALSSEIVKKIEGLTGEPIQKLEGVVGRIMGKPPRIIISPAFPKSKSPFPGEPDGGTECNGLDNMWQGQKSCGNFIKKC